MKPQEKAKELIERFEEHADWNNEYGSAEKQANVKHAKQCALICVQEIILSNPRSNPLNTSGWSTMGYWDQVKREIEKI